MSTVTPGNGHAQSVTTDYPRQRDRERAKAALIARFPKDLVLFDLYSAHLARSHNPQSKRYALALFAELCTELGIPWNEKDCAEALDKLDGKLRDARKRFLKRSVNEDKRHQAQQ